MEIFAGVLLIFIAVILIVSLSYVLTTSRHKERMLLIEKGLNPKDFQSDYYFLNSIKVGILLVGVGVGFLLAAFFDFYIFPEIDSPAIYAGCILLFGGISLVFFYAFFNKKA